MCLMFDRIGDRVDRFIILTTFTWWYIQGFVFSERNVGLEKYDTPHTLFTIEINILHM